MGGSLETSNTSQYSIKEYFDQLCSYCLSLGMTLEQFWDDDPELIKYFIEAEKIRQKKANAQMWVQGAYIQLAIGSCLDKKVKYPTKPIPLSKEEIEEERNRRLFMLRDILIEQATQGGDKNGKQRN